MSAGSASKLFVVVSGAPGSGKSTLAARLAPALGLTLLAKDAIKETLLAACPAPDVAASRALGRVAVDVLLTVAHTSAGAVLDSVWHRSHAASRLAGLPGDVVEVHCHAPAAVAQQRYADRVGSRAAGFFDAERTDAELVNDETANPVAGGWPVIVVDTSVDVDVAALVERIRADTSHVHDDVPRSDGDGEEAGGHAGVVGGRQLGGFSQAIGPG